MLSAVMLLSQLIIDIGRLQFFLLKLANKIVFRSEKKKKNYLDECFALMKSKAREYVCVF